MPDYYLGHDGLWVTPYCIFILGCARRAGNGGLYENIGAPATFLASWGTPAQLPGKLSYLQGLYVEVVAVNG